MTNVKNEYSKQYPTDLVMRIFRHKNSIIVEARLKNQPNNEYPSMYRRYNPDEKTFEVYNPFNVSLKEIDAFFDSAQNPVYIRGAENVSKTNHNISRRMLNDHGSVTSP